MGNNFFTTINLYLDEFERREDNNIVIDPNEFPLKYEGNYNNGPVEKDFNDENTYSLFFVTYSINPSKYITVKCSDKDDKIVEISYIKNNDYYVEQEYTKDSRVFLEEGKLKYSENIGSKIVSVTLKTKNGRVFRCNFNPDQPPAF